MYLVAPLTQHHVNAVSPLVLQLQDQLDAVGSVLEFCPPSLKSRLEEMQEEVVERWEQLRGHAEQRGEELKVACQRFLFLNTVKTEHVCGPAALTP